MKKNCDISILVPIFNEQDSILTLFKQIKNNIDLKYIWELIFVNDGSTDKSREIILNLVELHNNVKLIDSPINKGKSESLYQGFQYCHGNIIITMDGDLQDDPSEINNFLSKINEGYDMVSGWKKNRKDPLSKIIPSKTSVNPFAPGGTIALSRRAAQ